MNPLSNFLEKFMNQQEAGLVVFELDVNAETRHLLGAQGFTISDNISECHDLLIQGASVAVLLHEEIAKELYDLLGDYGQPVGLIQSVNAQTLKVSLKSFERERTKLLVVATQAVLSNIEKRLPLSERVGMVERLS